MHANGNQIMEGKVLDEQVKIRIFEVRWYNLQIPQCRSTLPQGSPCLD